jgi:HEAT repeats/Putative zinc-finger
MTDHDMSDENTSQPCALWQPLLMLSAAGGELEPVEQARLAAHLAACAPCAASLEREQELLSVFSAHRSEPDANLLASCRASLDDALDREEEGGWLRRTLGLRLPANWLSPRPAWSAAVLLVIGFSVGAFVPRLLQRSGRPGTPADLGAAAGNAAVTSPSILDPYPGSPAPFDLHSAEVAGISLFPSGDQGPSRVQLQLKAQQPLTVEGTVDDANVKDALLDVLASGDRVCPDVRLTAVEGLSQRSSDPAVRSALCHAVRKDPNAAVRLKALEALDDAGSQEMVRQTMLDALVDDQNPGVRIEAINALREMAAKGQMDPDGHTLDVLRQRMQNDPNTYIRLQSAAAIRDIGPREKF